MLFQKPSPAPEPENDEQTTNAAVSRRRLLRNTAIAGAALAPLGILAAYNRPTAASNQARLGTANTLQQPQVASINSDDPYQTNPAQLAVAAFQEIQSDENAHVTFLQGALKSNARPKPTFKGLAQTDFNTFVTLSRTFENIGVGAYLMAAPAISNKDYLAAAGSILTIEARHAGFLDFVSQKPLGPNGAFDKPMAQADIVSAASQFITSLNGGPDPSMKLANDTDILNFALLLEFLEAEFYNLNVPQFFGGRG